MFWNGLSVMMSILVRQTKSGGLKDQNVGAKGALATLHTFQAL